MKRSTILGIGNGSTEEAFDAVMKGGNSSIAEMLRALRSFLKENDVMAYLTMMAGRLVELHRVLKPTGSLYLHCDPTASHYLKLILDAIFGPENFLNEIIWKRTTPTAALEDLGQFTTSYMRAAKGRLGMKASKRTTKSTLRNGSSAAAKDRGKTQI